MPRKTDPPTLEFKDDHHTDYVLIAIGVGAAFGALIYLLLT